MVEAVQKTKAAVRRLVEIAPESGEAHDGLARVSSFDWDWETYRREVEKAVELAPNDAGFWQNYCFMLMPMTGRMHDATAHCSTLTSSILSHPASVLTSRCCSQQSRVRRSLCRVREDDRDGPELSGRLRQHTPRI